MTRSWAFWVGWQWWYVRGVVGSCAALERACVALDADWSIEATWPALAANTARFVARDYLLDCQTDADVLSRFDVRGYERLRATLSEGRGAILVGSHLGHTSRGFTGSFAAGSRSACWSSGPGTCPPSSIAGSTPGARIRRPKCSCAVICRPPWPLSECSARGRALRDGLAIYLNGDIPWSGPNTCPGRLLGRPQRLLAIWTELAVLTGTPVFLVFCTHLPAGRFSLEIEAIGHLRPGEEETAVADYLKQLEARIASSPADAVAHLVWPCYESPSLPQKPARKRKMVGSSR